MAEDFKQCNNCGRFLPKNLNARYRWKGLEFCRSSCKLEYIEEDNEVKRNSSQH